MMYILCCEVYIPHKLIRKHFEIFGERVKLVYISSPFFSYSYISICDKMFDSFIDSWFTYSGIFCDSFPRKYLYSYRFLNSYKRIHQSGLSYFVCTYRSELECAEVLFLPYSFLIFDVAKIRQFLNSKKILTIKVC